MFLIHGRDSLAARSVRDFLRRIGLAVVEWNHAAKLAGGGAPFVLDIVRAGLEASQAVVVLFTPDEEVKLKSGLVSGGGSKEYGYQARPNVWFEAGMALAMRKDSTILVRIGNSRSASDIDGIHFISLTDAKAADLLAFVGRLEAAGCEVDKDGRDYIESEITFTK